MAFALKVDEGDEHEQAANKKSHMSVPSRRASTKHSRVSQNNVKTGAQMISTLALCGHPCSTLSTSALRGEADIPDLTQRTLWLCSAQRGAYNFCE